MNKNGNLYTLIITEISASLHVIRQPFEPMEYFYVRPIGHCSCSFLGFSLMVMFIYWSLAMTIFVLTITYNANKKNSHLTHSSLISFIMKNHGIFRAKPSHSISYFMRLNYIQFSDLLKNRAHINHLIWFGWVFRKLNEKKNHAQTY